MKWKKKDVVHIQGPLDCEIIRSERGSCVYVFPNEVQWLKTSTSGEYIINLLIEGEIRYGLLLKKVGEHYGIPVKSIEMSISALLDGLWSLGVLQVNGKSPSVDVIKDIADLSLQQAWLNITDSCNLDCPYCYVPGIGSGAGHMSEETLFSIIDQSADMGVVQLVFSGGEPTLHPQLIPVLKYARQKKQFSIQLVTNGSMDSPDFLEELCPLIDDLQISVDGVTREQHDSIRGDGSFSRLSNVFKFVQNRFPNMCRGLSFTPLPENYEVIPQLFRLAKILDAKYIHLTRPKYPGKDNNPGIDRIKEFTSKNHFRNILAEYDKLLIEIYQGRIVRTGFPDNDINVDMAFDPGSELYSGLRRTRCAAGVLTMCIRPDGRCYPCAALCSEEHAMGDIGEATLKEVYGAMRSAIERCFSVDSDPECQSCTFRYFCGGGCHAAGDGLSVHDRLCHVLKERYVKWLNDIGMIRRKDYLKDDISETAAKNLSQNAGCN